MMTKIAQMMLMLTKLNVKVNDVNTTASRRVWSGVACKECGTAG